MWSPRASASGGGSPGRACCCNGDMDGPLTRRAGDARLRRAPRGLVGCARALRRSAGAATTASCGVARTIADLDGRERVAAATSRRRSPTGSTAGSGWRREPACEHRGVRPLPAPVAADRPSGAADRRPARARRGPRVRPAGAPRRGADRRRRGDARSRRSESGSPASTQAAERAQLADGGRVRGVPALGRVPDRSWPSCRTRPPCCSASAARRRWSCCADGPAVAIVGTRRPSPVRHGGRVRARPRAGRGRA